METCNSGRFFAKKKKKEIFTTGMPFFLLFPPENEFLQTMKNSQLSPEKKFM